MPDTITQKRNQFLKAAAEFDIEIMKLNDMIAESLQKAVDIEMQSLGAVSDITRNFLEAYHYQVQDGRVAAIIQVEETQDRQAPENKNSGFKKPLPPPQRIITQAEFDKLITQHREKQHQGIYEILDLSNCFFEDITFKGSFQDILFMKSDFKNCTFQGAQMENISFSKADFIGGEVLQSNFCNCNFYDAGINFAQFDGSIFHDCSFLNTAFFSGKISENQFYQCDFSKSWIGQTEFVDNTLQECEGMDYVDVSNNTEAYQQKFKENPFADNGIRYKYIITTADFKNKDFRVALQIYKRDKLITESEIKVDYNTRTHKVRERDGELHETLLKKTWLLMQPEIEKEIQKQEYENRIPTAGLKVMVQESESLYFQENRMYDLKEFAARIASFDSKKHLGNMQYQKVNYTLIFNTPEGRVQHYKNRYYLGEESNDFLKHIKEARFFNNTEINYIESYIKNKAIVSPVQETVSARKESQSVKKPYRGEAYMKGTGEKQMPICVTGHTPEEVLAALRSRNQDLPVDKQLITCYMKKENPETHRYETLAKYDIKTGLDITPIYLQLPHLREEQWEKMKELLKKNGAKYNPEKKAFYITRQNDLNFFASYIPANIYSHLKAQTPVVAKNSPDHKVFVCSKLNENKGRTNSAQLNQQGQKTADAPVL